MQRKKTKATQFEPEISFPSKNCFLDDRRPCSEKCRWRNDSTKDCRFLELFQFFVQAQFQGQQVDFTKG